jgi:GNAT superfamily N-acetyltransferase
MTSSNVVSIRKATPTDGSAILELIYALAEYEKLPPPDTAAQTRLLTDAFSEHPRFEVFLAEVDGKVVGYAFVFETYSTFLALPTLYLEDIFVLEAYRGQRVGHALFQHCVREAHRRGCGRMEWVVLDWNMPSIEFYKKRGGQHLTEWQHYRLTAEQIADLAQEA